ncbi:hypothetical protein F7725_019814 [Dissostichus mawsoni]|uniref:RRM domain-containing protein n=1 Tax=Dissostichus mawsoni TaxID=36200 RepID=A0A7J5YKW8_DISMA|nr:hypothetical protein F7725_019814 [Dissostichus mawsoni]
MSGCRIFIGRLSPSAREKDVERFFKGYGRIRDIDLKRGFGFVEFDDPRDAEDAVYELDGKELCSERVTIEHARVRLRGGRGGSRGGSGGSAGGRFSSDRYGRGSQNSRSRNPPPMRTENRLIVENLSSRVSWQSIDIPSPPPLVFPHIASERESVNSSQVPMDNICSYGCRDKGGPGVEPCALLVRENGALGAKGCPSGATAVQFMQMDLKDFMRQAGEVTFADAHRPKLNEGVVEFASSSDLKNAMDKLSGKEINGRKIKLIEAARKRSRSRSRSESSSRSRSRSRGRSPSRSPRRSRSPPHKTHNRSRSRSRSVSPAGGANSPSHKSKDPPKRSKMSRSATPPSPMPLRKPLVPALVPALAPVLALGPPTASAKSHVSVQCKTT